MDPEGRCRIPVEVVSSAGEVIDTHSRLTRPIGDGFVVAFEQGHEIIMVAAILDHRAIGMTGQHGLEVI